MNPIAGRPAQLVFHPLPTARRSRVIAAAHGTADAPKEIEALRYRLGKTLHAVAPSRKLATIAEQKTLWSETYARDEDRRNAGLRLIEGAEHFVRNGLEAKMLEASAPDSSREFAAAVRFCTIVAENPDGDACRIALPRAVRAPEILRAMHRARPQDVYLPALTGRLDMRTLHNRADAQTISALFPADGHTAARGSVDVTARPVIRFDGDPEYTRLQFSGRVLAGMNVANPETLPNVIPALLADIAHGDLEGLRLDA